MTSAERECNSLFFERYNLQHKFQMHFFILIQGITKSPGMNILYSSIFMKKMRWHGSPISYILRYQLYIKVKLCPHLSFNCMYQDQSKEFYNCDSSPSFLRGYKGFFFHENKNSQGPYCI